MNANSHGPEHAGTFLLRRGSGRRLRSGQLARGRAGGRAFARAICPRLHTSTPRHTRVAVRCPIGAAYRLVLPRADTRACEVMVYANITETDQHQATLAGHASPHHHWRTTDQLACTCSRIGNCESGRHTRLRVHG